MSMGPRQRDAFLFNGIDGLHGTYLWPPRSVEEVARLALGEILRDGDEDYVAEARWLRDRRDRRVWALEEGRDPDDLAQAGWGVVFPPDPDPAVRDALEPLLALRRRQAGVLYRELLYTPPDSKPRFLARHGAGPGPVTPEKVPYYLLLVGDPESLPFDLQSQLALQYAVGRLAFDTPEEYARYAAALVRAEHRSDGPSAGAPAGATLFGPRTDGDPATEGSHDDLLRPLAATLRRKHPHRPIEHVPPRQSTRRRLLRLLHPTAPEAPGLLFTAGHGMGFPPGHPRQREEQGALLCQDWPGVGQIEPGHYLSAEDLAKETESADPTEQAGHIALLFGCFTLGTPRRNRYLHRGDGEPEFLAPHPFVARLPQRLLAHPQGGTLAVLGQVDRAWSHAYRWPEVGPLHSALTATVERLLSGGRAGWATEPLGQRHGELTADLHQLRGDIDCGLGADHMTLATLWTACNDARGFLLLGDPAVRLARQGEEKEEEG
jgi:hypothetical protein